MKIHTYNPSIIFLHILISNIAQLFKRWQFEKPVRKVPKYVENMR